MTFFKRLQKGDDVTIKIMNTSCTSDAIFAMANTPPLDDLPSLFENALLPTVPMLQAGVNGPVFETSQELMLERQKFELTVLMASLMNPRLIEIERRLDAMSSRIEVLLSRYDRRSRWRKTENKAPEQAL